MFRDLGGLSSTYVCTACFLLARHGRAYLSSGNATCAPAGGANLFTRLYVDLYHAARKASHSVVRDMRTKVMNVCELLVEDRPSSRLFQ